VLIAIFIVFIAWKPCGVSYCLCRVDNCSSLTARWASGQK